MTSSTQNNKSGQLWFIFHGFLLWKQTIKTKLKCGLFLKPTFSLLEVQTHPRSGEVLFVARKSPRRSQTPAPGRQQNKPGQARGRQGVPLLRFLPLLTGKLSPRRLSNSNTPLWGECQTGPLRSAGRRGSAELPRAGTREGSVAKGENRCRDQAASSSCFHCLRLV